MVKSKSERFKKFMIWYWLLSI